MNGEGRFQMTKCTGLMGWIFGHKFKDYVTFKGKVEDILSPIPERTTKFMIRCKRCGAKCDD
jgi:hypothetical protein